MEITPKQRLKAALISVLVGSLISAVTLILQALIDFLHGIDIPSLMGLLGVMGHYAREIHDRAREVLS